MIVDARTFDKPLRVDVCNAMFDAFPRRRARLRSRLGLKLAAGSRLRLWHTLEQAPHRESRVRLAEQVDALGVPRVELHWKTSEGDERSFRRSREMLHRAFLASGLGQVEVEEEGEWPPPSQAPPPSPSWPWPCGWPIICACFSSVVLGP